MLLDVGEERNESTSRSTPTRSRLDKFVVYVTVTTLIKASPSPLELPSSSTAVRPSTLTMMQSKCTMDLISGTSDPYCVEAG